MREIYRLDRDTLTYKKVENSLSHKLKSTKKYFIVGGILALLGWVFFFYGIAPSPEAIVLKQKNRLMVNRLSDVNKKFDHISNGLALVQHRDDNLYRVISQKSPIPSSVRKAGFGGVNKYENLEDFSNSELLIESNLKSDVLLNQLNIQEQSYDTITAFAQSLNDSLLSIPAISPVNPLDYYYISSYFGYRVHPVSGKRKMHDGIDFAANIGKPIYATGNGKVVIVRSSKTGYGKRVTINHGFGYRTTYAHMDEIFVKKNEEIKRGQLIGTVGNTGTSTGPHLHYEVIKDRKNIDPIYYYVNDLTGSEYMEMILALTKS